MRRSLMIVATAALLAGVPPATAGAQEPLPVPKVHPIQVTGPPRRSG